MPATVVFMSGARYVPTTWDTGTWGALLAVDTWSPDPTTEEFVADMVGNELTVAGYARDAVAGLVLTVDLATNTVVADCDDFAFGSGAAGEVAGWAVIYRDVTNDSDSELVCAIPISRVTDGTALDVNVNPSGLLILQEC